jgi:tripartite-type tricarboxylate transporter receptor subunit TctC
LRRRFGALLIALAGWQTAAAQDYPSRAVKIVVPFAAGSSTDILARVIGKDLQRQMGQPFIVENKAGADGMIAESFKFDLGLQGQVVDS